MMTMMIFQEMGNIQRVAEVYLKRRLLVEIERHRVEEGGLRP